MTDPFAVQPFPDGADIEIIERRSGTSEGAKVVLPNEVRINGVAVALPKDRPIVIDPIDFDHPATTVTITMFARRVSIRQHDEPA